jgi:hypothetical protein
LGARVFYFYARFPYHLFSLADLMLIGDRGDFAVLSVGHFLLYLLSGAAFYGLARRYIARFWATAAAIGYMLAPYHYIDLECRAAMGEACGYIWIPMI